MARYFEVVDEQLYAKPMGKYRTRRAVPSFPERELICREAHENLGHCGRDKMLAYLKRRYWWKNMAATVEATARTCVSC
jgi:Integrase zinc binding domain